MPRDAQIIPMHRTVRAVQASPLRRAVGDGITWEPERIPDVPAPGTDAGVGPTHADGPRRRAGRGDRPAAARPAGVRRTRPSVRVRRRRATLLLLVAVTIVTLLALPLRVLAGASSTLGTSTPPLRAGQVYVVRPGDTLWSIAERLDPTGDPTVAVGRMESRLGTDTVYPGEHIPLP